MKMFSVFFMRIILELVKELNIKLIYGVLKI